MHEWLILLDKMERREYSYKQTLLNIRAIIKDKKLTESGVADMLGINQGNFSRIINHKGDRSFSVENLIEDLPRVLGISLIEILTYHIKNELEEEMKVHIDAIMRSAEALKNITPK